MCLRLGGLSVGDFRKVLMKTGLVLVVLGHVSFITAALLHGTVLRYVGTPKMLWRCSTAWSTSSLSLVLSWSSPQASQPSCYHATSPAPPALDSV